MSKLIHPVGPQPARVYWRRRAYFALALVGIIVAIVLIVVRPGAGSEGGVTTTPAATTALQTPAPGETPQAEPTVAPGETVECTAENTTITAKTDLDVYDPTQTPQLSFAITNNGANPCTINVGTAAQVYTVSSGPEQYWASTDCQTEASDAEMVIEPGQSIDSSALPWDRTRSATDTCEVPDRPAAPAGGASYHLSVSVDGIESAESKQFILQ